MAHLDKKISRWVEQGLLSRAQADAIIAFENREPGSNWAVVGVAGIGIVALLTGVVSVIAANWWAIAPAIKLLLYFAIQCALAGAFVGTSKNNSFAREVFLLLNQLFVLAGIGLIAQIYNLYGDGWQALALWLTLVLPLTLQAKWKLACHLWFIGLIAAVAIWLFSTAHEAEVRSNLIYALAICNFVFALCINKPYKLSSGFSDSGVFWCLLVFLCIITLGADVAWSTRISIKMEAGQAVAAISMLSVSLLAAVSAVVTRQDLQLAARRALGLMLLLVPIFFVPALFPRQASHQIIGCLGFLAIWTAAGTAAALCLKRRYFNFASLVIALRFVVVYFQVFGSLMATGIGLILSGGVILLIACAWHQVRIQVSRFLWRQS